MPRRERRSGVLRRRAASVHPAARPLTSRPAARGQSGYTLIEVIIAVALTGLVILSLATAMLAIVRTNALNSDRQRVDAAMTSFSESVRGGDYFECGGSPAPTGEAYRDADGVWAPPAGIEVDVTRVEFWSRTDDRFVAACPGTDGGAQRLTLTVTQRDLERSAQIVVRR